LPSPRYSIEIKECVWGIAQNVMPIKAFFSSMAHCKFSRKSLDLQPIFVCQTPVQDFRGLKHDSVEEMIYLGPELGLGA
jgi:hypothetical protein